MSTFTQSIVNGEGTSLQMAKTLLTSPTLIYTGEYASFKETQLPFAVPLEVESHKMDGNAEVSESLVIAKTHKVVITDNVAPGSWTWQLSGYIPGLAAAEQTNFFTPFVTLNTQLLMTAFKRGYVMIYKDIDASIYRRVVIKSLAISHKADCANKRPFMMTLKEINVMDDILASVSESVTAALPLVGGSLGSAISMGCTVAATTTVGALQKDES